MNLDEIMQLLPSPVVQEQVGDYFVSTIKINGPGSYFETLVFDANEDEVWGRRAFSLDDALTVHETAVGLYSGLDNPSAS